MAPLATPGSATGARARDQKGGRAQGQEATRVGGHKGLPPCALSPVCPCILTLNEPTGETFTACIQRIGEGNIFSLSVHIWGYPSPMFFPRSLVPGPFRGYPSPRFFPGHWSQVLSGGTQVPGSFPGYWSQVLSRGTPVLAGGILPQSYPDWGYPNLVLSWLGHSSPGWGYPAPVPSWLGGYPSPGQGVLHPSSILVGYPILIWLGEGVPHSYPDQGVPQSWQIAPHSDLARGTPELDYPLARTGVSPRKDLGPMTRERTLDLGNPPPMERIWDK